MAPSAAQPFCLIAHRGHQGRAPESTHEAVRAALSAGFPHVELDVQLTADGVPIILHDEKLGRTVQGAGDVAQRTWEQLRERDAGSWCAPDSPDWAHVRIPLLDDVLRQNRNKMHLHLELKSRQEQLPGVVASSLRVEGWVDGDGRFALPDGAADAADANGSSGAKPPLPPQPPPQRNGGTTAAAAGGAREESVFGVPGLTITSFHKAQLAASLALLPGVRHAWLVHELSDDVLLEARDLGISQLCPRADLLTPAAVSRARQAGFSVRAWGLKTDELLVAAVRSGAQGGTVDFPDRAAAVLAGLGGKAGAGALPRVGSGVGGNALQQPAAAAAAAAAGGGQSRPASSLPRVADFRSDTVTKPTPGMLQAMVSAEVGDDVWGDDPTVNALQSAAARLFGLEAGLFCPSGTMTNQIAIKCWTTPGDELLCSDKAHVYLYEGGGIAFNSGVQARLLPTNASGRITAEQVRQSINADDAHFPRTALCVLENTTNKGGGAVYSLTSMRQISQVCREQGLKLHLDGARVFNALAAARDAAAPGADAEQRAVLQDGLPFTPLDLGGLFDSISICLSKGLGCPVGSLLLGSTAFIKRAHRIRKVLGGGMRQAGFLAAAGLYALEHHTLRLSEDHGRARRLGQALQALPGAVVASVAPVSTNIVIFTLAEPHSPQAVQDLFKERASVLLTSMGGRVLRFTTHLDLTDEDVDAACTAIAALPAWLGVAAP